MDKVKISKLDISGVNNPLLQIMGTFQGHGYSLEFLVDGKKVKPKEEMINELLFFEYKILLNKDSQKVKIYLVHNDEKELLCQKKTSTFKRKVHKLVGIIHFQGLKIKAKLNRSGKNNDYYYPNVQKDYLKWVMEQPNPDCSAKLKYNPLFSIVTPVYNVSSVYLSECIDSVLNQKYENWELLLVDDKSTNQETLDCLKKYEKLDKRIRVIYRRENGNIALATNTGFKEAKGEYIGLLDNDDTLSLDALYQMAKRINRDKKTDFLYSDEDKLDSEGKRCTPYFKSDFAPDTLLSNNYICHFTVFKKSLLNKVGGEKTEFNGAQDYDLFLRLTEKAEKIEHISRILYHWRIIKGSTSESIAEKSYAILAGQKAIEAALKRRKTKGYVTSNNDGTYVVHYETNKPSITIIIPTKDYASTLKTCIDSIYEKSTYPNYDILVVNNNSEEEETFALFDEYKKAHENFNVIDLNCPFNFAYLMNEAVKKAKGDYLLFLNNDTEVITPDFLEQMVGYASQPHIGMVGVKLLFFDNTIQHGGVILGIRSMAAHAYEFQTEQEAFSFGKLNMPTDYAAVTAACSMISKEKYNLVKGMDEHLANNFNDVELNIRLLKQGFYNVYLGNVKMYHYESKTRGIDKTKAQIKRTSEEREYVLDKWHDIVFDDPFYNPCFSKNEPYVLEKKQ